MAGPLRDPGPQARRALSDLAADGGVGHAPDGAVAGAGDGAADGVLGRSVIPTENIGITARTVNVTFPGALYRARGQSARAPTWRSAAANASG